LAALGGAGQGTGLSQQELETRLWAAANSLRGPVDRGELYDRAYAYIREHY
jgi:hypothetical protein